MTEDQQGGTYSEAPSEAPPDAFPTDRRVAVEYTVEKTDSLMPGHTVDVLGVEASDHGFRLKYAIKPVPDRTGGRFAPISVVEDDAGRYWDSAGGAYGPDEAPGSGRPPAALIGELTAGPGVPRAGVPYRIKFSFTGDPDDPAHAAVVKVLLASDVPWLDA